MEERESMKGKRNTVRGESESGACIERKRTNRAWNFSVESVALNVAKTEKTDVLYPVLDRLSRPIEEGRRRKKGEKSSRTPLVSGMDYGIGWNSGPESPPCLF